MGTVIYLHGFASSPRSSKAEKFRVEATRHGYGFACPDFNNPAFETLTVTRMLEQTAEAIAAAPADPVALVGSSLGGFVAVLTAAGLAGSQAAARITALILMAPALDFGGNRLRQLGEHGVDEWRRRGSLRVFHYADGVEREVGYALYEDAARYDAMQLDLPVPVLAFQGRHDASVSPATVEDWARRRPYVDLRMLEDDHQLASSADSIVQTSLSWLQRREPGVSAT